MNAKRWRTAARAARACEDHNVLSKFFPFIGALTSAPDEETISEAPIKAAESQLFHPPLPPRANELLICHHKVLIQMQRHGDRWQDCDPYCVELNEALARWASCRHSTSNLTSSEDPRSFKFVPRFFPRPSHGVLNSWGARTPESGAT